MAYQDPISNTPRESSSPTANSEAFAAEGPILAEAVGTGAVPTAPLTGWKRIRFLFKVVEIRMRFILILVVTFVLIGKWDTIKNWWDKLTRPTTVAKQAQSDTEYFCPMHPSVVRDGLEPDGSVPKCPICGMPLSLHKKGAHVDLPEGVTARVQLSPERIQMAGVATAEVEYRPLVKEIRTYGVVDYDQSRQSQIVSRTSGFVDKLYVDKTYVSVRQGEPLALIYSPDLQSTADDLVLALNRGATDLVESGKQRLKNLGIADNEIDEIVGSRELLVALKHDDKAQAEQATESLQKLGMADAEIDEIKSTRRAATGLVIRSPVSGHVINKAIVQGAKVDAGMTLFDIADLTHAWIEADVFENDISLLHAGQEVEVTLEGLPNQVFHGQILLVHPHVETASRTNRIRIDLPNPDHVLRPGMYANVTVKVPFQEIEPFKSTLAAAQAGPKGTDDKSLIAFQKTCPVTGNKLGSMGAPVKRQVGDKTVFLCCKACIEKFDAAKDEFLAAVAPPPQGVVLTVPERAVIDTGSKKVVYVEREPGTFDGIEVQLGPESDGFFPVVKGLRVGDRVANRGAFLVDADSKLNPAAAAAYIGASGGPSAVARGGTTVAPSSVRAKEKGSDESGSDKKEGTGGPPSQGSAATQAEPMTLAKPTAQNLKNLDGLPPADRAAALAQQNCPISEAALGSMGVPFKVELTPGTTAFLCCDQCKEEATKDPQKTVEKLAQIRRAVEEETKKR
jgi:membrane fusion protein, copper/silver efflux system